ncbi:putative O-methyltransferase [Pyrobaculum oguniense TE7]|uniref:site-specific DNA-methyltransferase (adenine-specific) n=1 Tax=Pyrobaculum oguniense (strain DSM 13380 / JCM 10595 / TE7) TaxID=698757 RepID=H6Q7I1_PYROT|nr:putative O-methyltransferase [Pyrobaculum oguniense TE7]
MGRRGLVADRGRVATPPDLAFYMVEKLFRGAPPGGGSRVLDAGCGLGVFIDAVLRWCRGRCAELPEVVGVEVDQALAEAARRRFAGERVRIVRGDFLLMSAGELGGLFDYVIGNPPYVSYEYIDPPRRELYKRLFTTAVGRFDLYILFFEKALSLLRPGGRLVFVTPEKYLYVLSAVALRRLLASYRVEEVELIREDAFGGVLAYPAITVVVKEAPSLTTIRLRDGRAARVALPRDGSPWLSAIATAKLRTPYSLGDLVLRISPGVATGRDDVFVIPKRALPKELEPFAYPTVGGRELSAFAPGSVVDYDKLAHVILIPYDRGGRLLDEGEAKPLLDYLSRWRRVLESRYAVRAEGKRWYAFHEDPPMGDLLRPKILWRDIAKEPAFYIDAKGLIIPKHTVYYLVPKDPGMLPRLAEYLNSAEAKRWLMEHCQRAANGYLRLQTHVLRQLPVPPEVVGEGHSLGRV